MIEPGQIVPIVVTVVAIISAAAAALLSDMLRTENARLRQANLALLAERKERQRRWSNDEEPNAKPVQVIASSAVRERPSVEAAVPSYLGSTPRHVRIGSPLAGVGQMNGSLLNRDGSSSGITDRGQTLEEARELARILLARTSMNGRAKPITPAESTCISGVGHALNPPSSGPSERAAPRRNWGVLLKPAGDRSESEGTHFANSANGSYSAELVAFDSLNSYPAQLPLSRRQRTGST